MAAKWADMDMQDVYTEWADSLSQVSIGAIGYAVEQSRDLPNPPNIAEFRALCRQYRPDDVLKLDRKFTAEEMAANRAKLAEIVSKFKWNAAQ